MNISGYGVSYNYNSGYGVSSNKATPVPSSAIPTEKPKTESKNNNTTNTYDQFKDMPKTNSISLPSWVYTKTEPTRSDEEILNDMAELAKKHAEQGTFQNRDYEFESLVREYVSSVSPDRESILENTMNEINENIKISNSQKDEEEKETFDPIGTLLQVLENMQKGEDKKIRNSDRATGNSAGQIIFNMSGDTYDAFVEDGIVKAAMIRDDNGETVMYLDEKGSGQLSVVQSGTDEEGRRRTELLGVYNEVYAETSSSKGIVSGNMFDAVG